MFLSAASFGFDSSSETLLHLPYCQCISVFKRVYILFLNTHSVSENGVDMDGVVMLASALCNQQNLRRVNARSRPALSFWSFFCLSEWLLKC